jgi:hypothetical protein
MPRTPVTISDPPQPIERHIHIIRGQKVMLDADLAGLYGVQTKRLNEAVKRNMARFPETFMFRLTREEANLMRSQFATTSKRRLQYQPLAFTEHGVVMLSSVLNSPRAIQMSILVVQAFVRLREMIAANKDLAARIERLEAGQKQTASIIDVLVDEIDGIAREIKTMKTLPPQPRRKIGFKL